jgi:hypothetical protein
VECTASVGQCGSDPEKPICVAAKCAPCQTDKQCADKQGGETPGICMNHQRGRCATDAETIYVQKGPSCAGGDGTRGKPFCQPQDGINAVTASKRVVVVRGPDSYRPWTASPAGAQVSVIGQAAPVVAPGAEGPVQISGGDVLLRGLTVIGGFETGIQSTGGIVRIHRCVIQGNKKGGISINGAGFEITNTIVAENGPAAQPVAWGGVLVLDVANKSPRLFKNNTLYRNLEGNIHCGDAFDITGSILFREGLPWSGKCNVTECCSGDPMLSSTYRLTSASTMCIDRLDAAMSLPEDIDGDPRPQGIKSDCGADEYSP